VEETSALAKRTGKSIENRNKTQLRTRDGEKLEAKDMSCGRRYTPVS